MASRWRLLLVALWLALAGAIAGWFAAGAERPLPDRGQIALHRNDWHLERKPEDPIAVTPAKWLPLPLLFGDYDLTCDLELAEGTEVDFLLRRVEPRPLGAHALPFHGRFQVLRLSTVKDGPPWRSRVEALLGPPGGVQLAAGLPATITIQARGRRLSANVAGKRLPDVLADDEHGGHVLIARGGKCAVRSLHIHNLGKPADGLTDAQAFFAEPGFAWHRLRWPVVGALATLLAGLLAVGLGATRVRVLSAAPLVVVGAWSLARWLFADQLPLLQPETASLWVVTLIGLPLFLFAALPGRARWLLGVPAVAAAGWLALQARAVEAPRSAPVPELDLMFGAAAGETIAEALAARVRGPRAIHVQEPHDTRVFLLGGQQLWDRGLPEEHLEVLLTGELHRELGRAVDVPCLPTVDGWSTQQMLLFRRCYSGYRPQVLVFGVPRDEAAAGADGVPRSDPANLHGLIASASSWCAENGCQLVLAADGALPAEFLARLRDVSATGIPLLVLGSKPPAELARELAAVIAPLLR